LEVVQALVRLLYPRSKHRKRVDDRALEPFIL
jgi:hypothetical protein